MLQLIPPPNTHTHTQVEGERKKAAKSLDEAKKRLARATKAQHAAEVAAAELRGKAEAERMGARNEVGACVCAGWRHAWSVPGQCLVKC